MNRYQTSRYGESVYLNIYDLTPFNNCLHAIGLGFYHTGIEISGIEYAFGGGGGIFQMPPKNIEFAEFRESVKLGEIHLLNSDIKHKIYNLSREFGEMDYHPILKNCNNFSNAVCNTLLNKDIPGFVNRWANMGKFFYTKFDSVYNIDEKDKPTKQSSLFSGTSYKLNNN